MIIIKLAISLVFVLVLTGADTAMSAAGILPIPAVLLSLILLLMAITAAYIFRRIPLPNVGVFRVYFVDFAVVFGVLSMAPLLGIYWMRFIPESPINLGPLAIYNTMICLFVLVACRYLDDYAWVQSSIRMSLIIYVLSVVGDLIGGGLFSVLIARPAGFLRNPNDGAFAIVTLMVGSLTWRRPRAFDLIFIISGLVGVTITLSRSGIILWLLTALLYLFYLWRSYKTIGRFVLVLSATASLGLLWVALVGASGIVQLSNADTMSRLEEIADLAGGNTSATSDDPRILLFAHYANRAAQHPVLGYGSSYAVSGYGTGASAQDDQGPHNVFLARYVDSGVLGLCTLGLFYLFWFVFYFREKVIDGLVYVVILTLGSIFSHDMLDRKSAVILLVLLAARPLLARRDHMQN